MSEPEQTFTDKIVTCRTAGCDSEGVAIDVLVPTDENPPQVVCGACGNPISDISNP